MSVIARKRKESQFEVIKHFYRLREDITDLLLRDFGYSSKKFENKMSKKQRENMDNLFNELKEVNYV